MSFSDRSTPELAASYKQVSIDVQMKYAIQFVEDFVKPKEGDRILDVGCGTGNLAEYLASLVGPKGFVLGVDPDANRTAIAKDRLKDLPHVRIETGSVPEAIKFGPFDIVLSTSVVHWFPKDKQSFLFGGIFDAVKPGGVFSFACPCLSTEKRETQISEDLLASQFKGSADPWADIGITKAPPSYWCNLTEQQGFHVIQNQEEAAEVTFPSISHVIKFMEASTVGSFRADKVDQAELNQLMTKYGYEKAGPVFQSLPTVKIVAKKPEQ